MAEKKHLHLIAENNFYMIVRFGSSLVPYNEEYEVYNFISIVSAIGSMLAMFCFTELIGLFLGGAIGIFLGWSILDVYLAAEKKLTMSNWKVF